MIKSCKKEKAVRTMSTHASNTKSKIHASKTDVTEGIKT